MMNEPQKKLSVKELANELQVSVRYVYQMRACGFPMPWDGAERCHVTTAVEAKKWIARKKFRLYLGKGRAG